MKSIIILFALIIFIPFTQHGQDKDLKKLFNQYKNVAGFELESEAGEIDMNLDGDWDFASFLNDIENIYVLEFDKGKGKVDDLKSFQSKLDKLIVKKEFKSMFDIEGESSFGLYTRKGGEDKTTDVLLVTSGDEESSFIWLSSN